MKKLKEVYESKWITNMGEKHKALGKALRRELKVSHTQIFNNGTIALLTAIKVLNLPYGSEIITTPFTFATTPYCISWNGCKPVFCDIEPRTITIYADKIENLITPKASAILGDMYDFPCNVDKIAKNKS